MRDLRGSYGCKVSGRENNEGKLFLAHNAEEGKEVRQEI